MEQQAIFVPSCSYPAGEADPAYHVKRIERRFKLIDNSVVMVYKLA